MKVKLTDRNGQTYNGCQWGEGVTHTAKRGKMEECSDTVIHYYDDPLLAVFYNPIHGNFKDYRMWEVETHGRTSTDRCKSWCKSLTTVREVDPPTLTTEQRVEIAIRVSLKVYTGPSYVTWAEGWLDGSDRSGAAAEAASDAAYAAAEAAAEAASDAAYAAADAAYAAAEAAYAAAEAAAEAAEAASDAAYAAAEAAEAASDAAYAAAEAAEAVPLSVDILSIVRQVKGDV